MRNLKFCLISFLLFAALTAGQNVTLSLGSGSGAAGSTVALPVILSTTGGELPAAVEFSFSYTSDITSVSVVVGSAATDANKFISCSGTTCVVWGMNSTPIAAGSVATAIFQVSPNPSANPIPIQITNVQVSDPNGGSILASANSGWISLPFTPGSTGLTSLSCAPSALASNATATCTISLSQAAAGYTSILLESNNTALTVPISVAIHSGQSTASFSATTGTLTAANTPVAIVSAALGSQSARAILTLQVPAATLTSVSCSPLTIGSNATSMCTVFLNQAAPANTVVSLSSNNAALSVPSSVTILSGQSSASGFATAGTLTSSTTPTAVVTAMLGSSSATATVTLQVPATQPGISLTCTPASIASNSTTTCTLTLSQAATSYLAAALQSNNTALSVPASVAMHSGENTTTFLATTGTLTAADRSSAIITATLSGQSAMTTVSLQLPTSTVVSNVTPRSLPVGVYRISVQGSGFTRDSRVSLGGSPLATAFVSETALTATGYATESHSSSLVVSDGVTTSAPIQIQIGVARPRLSYAAAARFLQQSSFGPQPESIMHLQQTGLQDWLEEQFRMQPVSNPDQPMVTNAVRNPDQLRQRVALALGQTAISDVFGNYREVLKETQSGEPGALDAIFNQPATGPSVATQLIQGLVTANPSPAYVQRVAAVFDNNNLGVRGDMRSVVSAALLDSEARAGDVPGNDATNGGRIQADTEFLPGLLRALGASETGGLATVTTGIDRARLVASVVASTDLTMFVNLAGTPESLADALDIAFTAARMPAQMKQTLTAAIAGESGGDLSRAELGIYLVTTSSEYYVRH